MTHETSALGITSQPLPEAIRTAIGDIFILGGMIEHLVAMAIFKMTLVQPQNGFVILKRMMLGDKLDRLRYFSNATGDAPTIADFAKLKELTDRFTPIRNSLAHGHYLGINGLGQYCFYNTADYIESEEQQFVTKIKGFPPAIFPQTVQDGKDIVDHLRTKFGVVPLHEIHAPQPRPPKDPARPAQSKSTGKA